MDIGVRAWSASRASTRGQGWQQDIAFVVEAERLGATAVWTTEAWGIDAVSVAGYLAAKTERMTIGTGIMQVTARAPAMAAMTALSLAMLTGNRFVLGLGMSNPQVVEGMHGVPFDRPLTRLREYVDIVRMAFRGEKLASHGYHYHLPLPGGEGKAIALARPGGLAPVPIHLATLAPNALRLTGEIADGWMGQSFFPEGAGAFLPHLEAGARAAGRTLQDLELIGDADVELGDDVDALIDARRATTAFRLGGMGSATTNFYTDAYARAGFEEAARHVQHLWVSGDHDAARRAVPPDMILRKHLLGTPEMVRERVRAYRRAGITTLRVDPFGRTLEARLETLARLLAIVREVNAEGP